MDRGAPGQCRVVFRPVGNERLSVAAVSAFGNLLSQTGFFQTDFRFFDLGRKPSGLETLLGLLDSSLGSIDIDVFGLLRDLSHDRDLRGCDFRIAPEHRHMAGLVSYAIPQFPDAEG